MMIRSDRSKTRPKHHRNQIYLRGCCAGMSGAKVFPLQMGRNRPLWWDMPEEPIPKYHQLPEQRPPPLPKRHWALVVQEVLWVQRILRRSASVAPITQGIGLLGWWRAVISIILMLLPPATTFEVVAIMVVVIDRTAKDDFMLFKGEVHLGRKKLK